ncbi:Hsp33 family molecular chaperone [Limoniibacter endophyticus]|uniref:33 kDa chaperonin n=1 Tax=Limoniibacter endophyticus TaxID=1565040 RepID=A0A8J3DT94_9HYPH|nr:Hsp33 family molecular chaperone [Limoniibacter endophyticus]GHC80333.1 33 kDa chaperonin [Limoniibacter endophyticus]
MTDTQPSLGDLEYSRDDHVVPFAVEPLDVRGRAVQIGPMLNSIMARHQYPEPVARLLAEAILMTVLIGTAMKFDGKFIVQTRSDGPVDLLVADFASPDAVRAYARFDAERLAEAVAARKDAPHELLGAGVLAMTIDQGAHTSRYQGVVALDGSTLEEVARTYFRQSEQIPTDVKMAVARMMLPGGTEEWRAGGLIAQFLPQAPERMRMADLPSGSDDEQEKNYEPDAAWQEAMALISTIEADELIDPSIRPERLLFRLFHEQGVRVFEGQTVLDKCSCSEEKIRGILSGFTAEELDESTEADGQVHVDCEFCSTRYSFPASDFR